MRSTRGYRRGRCHWRVDGIDHGASSSPSRLQAVTDAQFKAALWLGLFLLLAAVRFPLNNALWILNGVNIAFYEAGHMIFGLPGIHFILVAGEANKRCHGGLERHPRLTASYGGI